MPRFFRAIVVAVSRTFRATVVAYLELDKVNGCILLVVGCRVSLHSIFKTVDVFVVA